MATTQLINPDSFLIPHTVTLETLFQADHFVVPDYQRDYSWGRQQASELWNDLEKTVKNAFPTPGQAVANPLPHFIGAIVVQRFSGSAAQHPEVMDGQQRMVTLSVLLSVLVESANKISDTGLRNSWTRTLEGAVASYAAGSLVPRIRLARDHAHYEALVCVRYTKAERDAYYSSLGSPSKRSVVYRVKEVADFFCIKVDDFLSGQSAGNFDIRFVELCKSILQLTVALRMSVTEQGVAYEVFETLNDRGLDLQQADLLKSKLVALGDRQGAKAQVVAAWERIVSAIESQKLIRSQEYSLTDFFFFHYLAVVNPEISRSELYAQVTKHLGVPGTSAISYIQDVAECAERLQQILEAGPTYASVVRDIEAIRDIFPNKYATCMLIAAAKAFGAADARTLEVIRLVHRFVFRRFVVGKAELSTYAGEIAEISHKLAKGVIANAAMLASELKLKANDAQFVHELGQFVVPDARVGFYVIEAIENYISAGQGIVLQRQSPNQHLEHVMPKRAGADWSHIDMDLHSSYLNRVGNLLVLERLINTRISNKDFKFKDSNQYLEDYQNSKLQLPKAAKLFLDKKTGQWDFNSINQRQMDLVGKYANSVWGL